MALYKGASHIANVTVSDEGESDGVWCEVDVVRQFHEEPAGARVSSFSLP